MAQKTFTQYLNRSDYRDPLVAESVRTSRAASKLYDALTAAKEARRVAARRFVELPDEETFSTPYSRQVRSDLIDARARKQKKYAAYQAAVYRENAAAREARSAPARREAAARFDPRSPSTVLDYATTAYPSKRGAEMGLQCPVFNVRVRGGAYSVTAFAIRNDGTVMGKVQAGKDDKYLSVSWSSLLEGGESLRPGSRTSDFRRCGVGPRLYEAIAEYACQNDLTMTSDTTLYPNSRAFWERQEAKDRAFYDDTLERFVVIDACGIRRTGMRGLTIKSKSKKRRKG